MWRAATVYRVLRVVVRVRSEVERAMLQFKRCSVASAWAPVGIRSETSSRRHHALHAIADRRRHVQRLRLYRTTFAAAHFHAAQLVLAAATTNRSRKEEEGRWRRRWRREGAMRAACGRERRRKKGRARRGQTSVRREYAHPDRPRREGDAGYFREARDREGRGGCGSGGGEAGGGRDEREIDRFIQRERRRAEEEGQSGQRPNIWQDYADGGMRASEARAWLSIYYSSHRARLHLSLSLHAHRSRSCFRSARA